MTKSVVHYSGCRIACSGQEDPAVILCLTDADLVAAHSCPDSEVSQTFEYTFIVGVLKKVWTRKDSCGKIVTWCYLVEYDEAQLSDPDTALTSAQVDGITCAEGCFSSWLQQLIGNEIYVEDGVLYTQHGCSYSLGGLTVTDTPSIDLELSGGELSANAKISENEGNILTIEADGLFVLSSPDPFISSITDTTSVDLSVSGGGALSAAVKISPNGGNQLSNAGNGLYVAPEFIVSAIDSTSIDIEVSGGGELVAYARVPTLTAVGQTNALRIRDDEPDDSGLYVAISEDSGNALEARADGLYATGGGGEVTIAPCYLTGFGDYPNNRLKMLDDGLYGIPYVGDESADMFIEVGNNEGPCDKVATIYGVLKYSEDPGNLAERRDDGLYVSGTFVPTYPIRTSTTAITFALGTDYTILANAASNVMEVRLSTVSVEIGQIFVVKKIDASANLVDVNVSGGGFIDDVIFYTLTVQNQSVTVQFDGTKYWIIARYDP